MYFLFLSMMLAYLAGSINFAILISRWVRGIDIRSTSGSGEAGDWQPRSGYTCFSSPSNFSLPWSLPSW